MSAPSPGPSGPRPSPKQSPSRKRKVLTGTLLSVVFLSLSIHFLFLFSVGHVTLFPGSQPRLTFVSQAAVPADEAEAGLSPLEAEAGSEPPPPHEFPSVATVEEAPAAEEMVTLADPGPRLAAPVPSSPVIASPTAPERAPAPLPSAPPKNSSPSLGGPSRAFFGIPLEPTEARVVVILDTSNTMFQRKREGQTYSFDFSVIKKETCDLVAGLSSDSLFNVIIYESGSQAYAGQMVLATEEAKIRAQQWILGLGEDPGLTIEKRPGPPENKLLEGKGTRLDTALKQALGFKPTVIFILTDGEVQRVEEGVFRWLTELRKLRPQAAKVHVVQYLTEKSKEEETRTLRQIAAKGGGKFRSVEARIVAEASR